MSKYDRALAADLLLAAMLVLIPIPRHWALLQCLFAGVYFEQNSLTFYPSDMPVALLRAGFPVCVNSVVESARLDAEQQPMSEPARRVEPDIRIVEVQEHRRSRATWQACASRRPH